jgi:hypothetical protein
MSWDVVIANAPGVNDLAEIGDDESAYTPLGTLTDVRSMLTRFFPDLDLTDPTWGDLDGGDFSIEFSVGSDDPVRSLMLHVRGSDRAVPVIRHLCQHSGWVAFDVNGPKLDLTGDTLPGLTEWRRLFEQSYAAAVAEGQNIIVSPRVNGVRFDMWVVKPKLRRWWQFWKGRG